MIKSVGGLVWFKNICFKTNGSNCGISYLFCMTDGDISMAYSNHGKQWWA